MPGTCPQCGSERVHRSRRRGLTEKLIALGSLKVRRCHECNTRLASFGGSVLLLKDLDKFLARAAMFVGMGIAMVLVVAIVVWFSRKQESQTTVGSLDLREARLPGREVFAHLGRYRVLSFHLGKLLFQFDGFLAVNLV